MEVIYYNVGFQFLRNYRDISVAHSSVHDMQSTGIYFDSNPSDAYAGFDKVSNVTNSYGYGIYFFGTINGLAEYNVVHGVGGTGVDYVQGMSTQGANNITIQCNEINIIIDAVSVNTASQFTYIHDIPSGVVVLWRSEI